MNGDGPASQGTRDAATVLPFVAGVLLMPPLIHIFAAPVTIAGIPLIVVYVFLVWAAVIIGAYVLARRLARLAAGPDDVEQPPPDGR